MFFFSRTLTYTRGVLYRNCMFQQYGASFFTQDVLRIGYASHLHFISYKASDIAAYWSTITFHGNPIVPLPVSCDGWTGDKFKSSSFITDFISSAIGDIKGGKHSEALALFQFTAEHADRRKNEIIFRKCQFILGKILCQFCQANSVIAQKVLDIVRRWEECLSQDTLLISKVIIWRF